MIYMDRFANAPANFDKAALEGMVASKAADGGNFMPITFKGTPRQLHHVLASTFDRAELSKNETHVIVTDYRGSCTVACNGYVSGWVKAA